ncbi:MAG: hypothetical protein JXR86_07825 [Spirochaetales bacterium]|nr:hypothetical protein [Spirochaetales bacterium]
MERKHIVEATCDNCARVFAATVKRYYCFHCDKYYYVCPNCAELVPKCRHCGIPLKRRTEPQLTLTAKRAVAAGN